MTAEPALLDAVRDGWAWKGLEPAAVLQTNAFGNALVRDTRGRIWRICPEELTAEVVADGHAQFHLVLAHDEFRAGWEMTRLVELAAGVLGAPGPGRCYCLKVPAVLGGTYSEENLGTIAIAELLSASGSMARQMDGLPDGTPIDLKVKE